MQAKVSKLEAKAIEMSEHVVGLGENRYQVASASGNNYQVSLGDKPKCSCNWGLYHNYGRGGSGCSHVRAAELSVEPEGSKLVLTADYSMADANDDLF